MEAPTCTLQELAAMIDHSLLQPVLTDQDLEAGCRVATRYRCATVCIKPYYLARCSELLLGTGVLPSTTIGFPHGGHTTAIKVAEARQALVDGGRELDMVVNIGKVLTGDWEYVRSDIQSVLEAVHGEGALLKVIFENCYLADEHKIALCEICSDLRVDFVKTSTGYGTGGSTLPDLQLMRRHSAEQVQVKAAGGVRTLDDALAVRAAGATRFGATRTAEILGEYQDRFA